MQHSEFFISSDWGTTNFRLRLVETDSLRILAEYRTGQGIRALFEKWRQQDRPRMEFFSAYLLEQLRKLPPEHREHPIVLSGMASSSIGMKELAYASLPLAGDGSTLHCQAVPLPKGPGMLLVSGVKGELDMMRGEETQAIGLEEKLRPHGEGILILPGTHSKHLTYREGAFTTLKTFMTGELFDLLARKSILANNVEESPWSANRMVAFREGLDPGFSGQLTANLFTVRARNLLHHADKKDNFYLLSGLLIGDELSYLKAVKKKIFLAATTPLFHLYRTALETIFDPGQLVFFDGQALDHALLTGQKKILMRYER